MPGSPRYRLTADTPQAWRLPNSWSLMSFLHIILRESPLNRYMAGRFGLSFRKNTHTRAQNGLEELYSRKKRSWASGNRGATATAQIRGKRRGIRINLK